MTAVQIPDALAEQLNAEKKHLRALDPQSFEYSANLRVLRTADIRNLFQYAGQAQIVLGLEPQIIFSVKEGLSPKNYTLFQENGGKASTGGYSDKLVGGFIDQPDVFVGGCLSFEARLVAKGDVLLNVFTNKGVLVGSFYGKRLTLASECASRGQFNID